jgi:phage terminase large subunit-like protein
MNSHKNYKEVMQYVESVLDGSKPACEEEKLACKRFKRDLEDDRYEFKPKDAEFVIQIIEKTFVHDQGEKLDGTPLRGEPFLLESFQKFITYSILGFFHKDTKLRKYKEAFIFIPRKNGKTRFIAALSWALSLLERKSGSSLYIVAASLKQSLQSFKFIHFNLKQMGEAENFRILNNNHGHFIEGDLGDGSIHIEALAANPDRQDSLNSNIQILDELHAYRSAKQYNVIKESGKAYSNKLTIGITTAGDNMNSFCYKRLKYCQKILKQTVKDEAYFVFITKADENKDGEVDYTDPLQHEKANPNYRVTIRPEDIMNDAMQAQNDPQQRKDFLAKSLNIYTSATKAYFNVDEFRASDREYKWTLEELAKLPIDWYGGADLSKLHDLTAGALYGQYKDIDITVTHAFFPITAAYKKAEEDNIPLFGWKDDGWLTMTNSAVVNHQVIVNWFKEMKKKGFKIKQVGFDRKFGREFFLEMKSAGFKIEDTPQLYYLKSEGFRRIEAKAKDKKFYYLHSDAYEYCLENVKAVERTDDAVKYEKVMPTQRIDIFDASVFAAMQMLKNLNKAEATDKWLNLGSSKDKKGGD